jgi:hypothetical protein
VLLSIHGEQAASRGLRGAESRNRYLKTGFVFGKQHHALDAILDDSEYYGTAFHSTSYVKNNWSTLFDVVESYSRNRREPPRSRRAAKNELGGGVASVFR